jgi:hypothetical protein
VGGDRFRRHGEGGGRRRPARVGGRRPARVEEEERKRLGIFWLIPCERIDHTLGISIACLFIQELQS